MRQKVWKLAGSILIVFVMLFSVNTAVFAAAEPPDPEKTGSISVTPHRVDNGHSVAMGMAFTLYQVATVKYDNGQLSYALTDSFSGSKADLSNLEASGLAQTMASYAEKHNLSGSTRKADSNGTVKYENLSLGLYLLVQADKAGSNDSAEPFLVTIPVAGEDGKTWIYDVDASPKTEVTKRTQVSVKKVWNDGKDAKNRPQNISVTLYRGNEVIGTVTLSDDNNWNYIWSDLPESDAYSVKEASVSGYQASYSHSGYAFTITNTSKLVQTGQLNWPIPILAISGVTLFAVGWGLVFLKRRNGKD